MPDLQTETPGTKIHCKDVLVAIYWMFQWRRVCTFSEFVEELRSSPINGMHLICSRIYAIASKELVPGSNTFRAKAVGKTCWTFIGNIEAATEWEQEMAGQIIKTLSGNAASNCPTK